MTDNAPDTFRRQLGAVLFADVVGYTRLMGENEDATYSALKKILEKLEASCQAFQGKVMEVRGDGVLALFDSATNAVRFAVEAQDAVEKSNARLPDDRKIRFRIGIHLGEILTDDRGIHGDSVNIAARLESVADPGRIFISSTVYEQVRNRLPFGYEFLGPHRLKNVKEPVPIYCVRAEIKGVIMASSSRPKGDLARRIRPEIPSVAILPFDALGGEDSDNWFADGITEDITRNLSKFKNLFVIARGSAFFYKAVTVPPQQVARDLGVRYITRGAIRRSGRRIRITVELIDIDSESTIWAERYDRDLDEIFAIQDEVTESIVAASAVVIEASERQRMSQAAPSSLAAYGYVLKGQQHIFKYTRRDNHEALALYEKALDADRGYARASAALSRTLNVDWRYSWSDKPDSVLDTALSYAQNAIELDPTDARGFGELGFVHLYRKEHQAAISAYKRAMLLNPNDADLMSDFADALAHAGSNEQSIALLERAMRLNPYYPDQYLWHLGGAYYNQKEYGKVVETILKMNNPTEGQRVLAASYAQLGQMDFARDIVAKHKAAHPNFSLKHWSTVVPDRLEEDTQHFVEGLKKAGF